MEDKHFNPLADLTKREHEVLHLIARELALPDSSQPTSGANLISDYEDCKAEPASAKLDSGHKLKD